MEKIKISKTELSEMIKRSIKRVIKENEESIVEKTIRESKKITISKSELSEMISKIVKNVLKESDEIDSVGIPGWALGYIFNGDATGLEDDEIAMVNQYLSNVKHISPPDNDVSPFFSRYPVFGKACEVYDCDVIYK